MVKFRWNRLKKALISMCFFVPLLIGTVSSEEISTFDYLPNAFACICSSINEDPYILQINSYVRDICEDYPRVNENLVKAVIWHESGYISDAVNYDGSCVGLMQVSPYWNSIRAEKLGVDDFMDPYSNILVGVDCLDYYLQRYDLKLSLMLYGMEHKKARSFYRDGVTPKFVSEILEIFSFIESGDLNDDKKEIG